MRTKKPAPVLRLVEEEGWLVLQREDAALRDPVGFRETEAGLEFRSGDPDDEALAVRLGGGHTPVGAVFGRVLRRARERSLLPAEDLVRGAIEEAEDPWTGELSDLAMMVIVVAHDTRSRRCVASRSRSSWR